MILFLYIRFVRTIYGNTDYSLYKSSTDYQKLSNERFKERNNHTDSWIDSKGKAHIH